MGDETPAERVSRFREHTNTTSSIRPPPAELWKDAGIDLLMDSFHDENERTPAVRHATHPRHIMSPTGARSRTAAARKGSDAAATVATAEGTFGRFSRVFASVFGGVLGKRKAGHSDAEPAPSSEQARLDERKRQAEEAYHAAKAQGLLPAPKVFVRPGMAARAWSADTPARPRPPLAPRTPGSIARSPSKKDLHKQKKLSRRVSSLEVKLASARKELQSVLGHDCFPAVPPLPPTALHQASASPTPNAPLVFSDDDTDDDAALLSPTAGFAFSPAATASLPAKITKKRKSGPTDSDSDYRPIGSDTDMDVDADTAVNAESTLTPPTRTIKRVKSDASARLKRTSHRLSRKVSRGSVHDRDGDSDGADTDTAREREDRVVVVKPGGAVPPVPPLPSGVVGRKVKVVGDDGYGGLGHEIF